MVDSMLECFSLRVHSTVGYSSNMGKCWNCQWIWIITHLCILDVCYVPMSQPDFLPKMWPWKLVGCKHCLASEQRSEKWMCSIIGNLPWKKITKTSRAFAGLALVWIHDVHCTCTFVGLLKKDFWCNKLALKNDKFLSFKSGASSDENASSLVQICRY